MALSYAKLIHEINLILLLYVHFKSGIIFNHIVSSRFWGFLLVEVVPNHVNSDWKPIWGQAHGSKFSREISHPHPIRLASGPKKGSSPCTPLYKIDNNKYYNMWTEQKARILEAGPREYAKLWSQIWTQGHMQNQVHLNIGFCSLSGLAGQKVKPSAPQEGRLAGDSLKAGTPEGSSLSIKVTQK